MISGTLIMIAGAVFFTGGVLLDSLWIQIYGICCHIFGIGIFVWGFIGRAKGYRKYGKKDQKVQTPGNND